MFRNILIPTDGSDLAAKAVEQGVLFAQEISAKITAVTVTEPFHFLSVSASQLEYTPIEYKKVRGGSGQPSERTRLSSNHRSRRGEKVRSDRDGLTWASRVSAVVLGSETVKVLTHSKIPVLVYC